MPCRSHPARAPPASSAFVPSVCARRERNDRGARLPQGAWLRAPRLWSQHPFAEPDTA
jgi:hypothetical protein